MSKQAAFIHFQSDHLERTCYQGVTKAVKLNRGVEGSAHEPFTTHLFLAIKSKCTGAFGFISDSATEALFISSTLAATQSTLLAYFLEAGGMPGTQL